MNLESWYAKGTTFVSGDRSIFYVREGTGIPLLCVHGFPTSSWDFAPIFPELTAKFDCIVPDLVGLGISKAPLKKDIIMAQACLLYTSPSPRDRTRSRMPSSA